MILHAWKKSRKISSLAPNAFISAMAGGPELLIEEQSAGTDRAVQG